MMNFVYSQDMYSIGQRIEEIRKQKGLSKTAIWKGAGLSSGVYSQWLNGQSLAGDNLIKVANILGVSPYWLQTGKGEIHDSADLSRPLLQENENGINLPLLNIRASMGNGEEVRSDELVIDVLRVTRSWVDKTFRNITSIENISFIHAIGDSMATTFNDGDILLVDSGVVTVDSDNIYVMEAHDRLFIKRVRQRIDGSYEISSDNPAVKTVDVLNGNSDVIIKGRVVWVWNGRKV